MFRCTSTLKQNANRKPLKPLDLLNGWLFCVALKRGFIDRSQVLGSAKKFPNSVESVASNFYHRAKQAVLGVLCWISLCISVHWSCGQLILSCEVDTMPHN